MKKILKKIIQPFYQRYHFWYHNKPRRYNYKKIYTIIQPSVFSPKHTISTKILLNYISTLNLKKARVLELGCGSGIISIYTASKGAEVIATDINKIALSSLNKTAPQQQLSVETIFSDLFDQIPISNFNYIFINPPYYPKNPKNINEQAWFCGENFEYFEKLFQQLPNQLTSTTNCLMILSDDCEVTIIKNIAKKNKLSLIEILEKQSFFEKNYIFKIESRITN